MGVYPDVRDKDRNFDQEEPFNVVPLNEIGLGEKPTRVKPR